jgi:GntR family transcriptional regulator
LSFLATPKIKQGGSALYGQIASLLRRRIETGEWKAGSRIPSLEELVRTFDVARVTVRQAVEILEAEGLLVAQQGRGTFVSQNLPERRWLRLGAEWADLLATVQELSPRMLALEDSERLPRLDPTEGALAAGYQYMRRVHSRNNEPYCILDVYLDKRVYDRAPEDFRTKIVMPLLGTVGGVQIGRAHQTLTIGSADAETAPHLGLPLNAPIAEVRRVICDQEGVVVYCGELAYRGDAIRLEIDLLNPRRT